MPPPRKTDWDLTTEAGKEAQSQYRNRGCDRVVGIVKDYQKASDHKVLVNFLPTWKNGVPRVWHSHPADQITPMRAKKNGKGFEPFYLEAVQNEESDDEAGTSPEAETPPGSQQMTRRKAATPGTKELKRGLKLKCGHCCTGPDLNDLHPRSAWLKCGHKGCKSTNFRFHAKCHGVKLSKIEEKSFNQKYMRCNEHLEPNQIPDSDSEVSDEDFMSTGRKKKPVLKKKSKPTKVFTPGCKDLPPLKKKAVNNEPDIVEISGGEYQFEKEDNKAEDSFDKLSDSEKENSDKKEAHDEAGDSDRSFVLDSPNSKAKITQKFSAGESSKSAFKVKENGDGSIVSPSKPKKNDYSDSSIGIESPIFSKSKMASKSNGSQVSPAKPKRNSKLSKSYRSK